MFGHDDKHKKDEEGGLPFTPPAKDEPTPDGTLDDSMAPPPPPPPTVNTDEPGLPFTAPAKPQTPTLPPPPPAEDKPTTNGDSDLVGIKQEALKQLSPLVEHLDQTPEEKFKTTMMMIQASDDDTLVSAAFEAAKQITDDKTRAQALLDVINEINYFTQSAEK